MEKIQDAIKRLHEEIKNIGDFYDDNEITVILKDMGDFNLEKIADEFVEHEWEHPIRRCSWCGDLMVEGYLLGDDMRVVMNAVMKSISVIAEPQQMKKPTFFISRIVICWRMKILKA